MHHTHIQLQPVDHISQVNQLFSHCALSAQGEKPIVLCGMLYQQQNRSSHSDEATVFAKISVVPILRLPTGKEVTQLESGYLMLSHTLSFHGGASRVIMQSGSGALIASVFLASRKC